MIGLDMTSTLSVKYTMTELATGEKVWQEDIASKYTAKLTSCCIGSIRLNKANEGAVRENIKQLVDKLAEQEW